MVVLLVLHKCKRKYNLMSINILYKIIRPYVKQMISTLIIIWEKLSI